MATLDNGMKVTTDHDEIRLWAQANDAQPEIVEDPDAGMDLPILRLNFPGRQDDIYLAETVQEQPISWDNFFQHFDNQQLAFIFDPDAVGPDLSLAYKFMKRDQLDQDDPSADPTLL